jgi:PAS domain S-box-containing protein
MIKKYTATERTAPSTDAGGIFQTAESQQRHDGLSALHTEIEQRFELLPNFFRLAPESPEITAHLWSFARFAYLDNPLPSLFKERLFVYLSRFCEVRYCITRHAGFLLGLGRPSGDAHSQIQTVEEIIRLIRLPFPGSKQLESHLAQCAACDAPLSELPQSDSLQEEAVFACATHIFLESPKSPGCLDALRRILGDSRLQYLLLFLSFVRTAHYWTKVHTELTLEDDIKELLAAHQPLAECLLNEPEAGACEMSRTLMDELTLLRETEERHLEAHQALRESEERLATELAATQELQSASAMLIEGGEGETDALYQKILDAAVAIMRSDFASMQMLYPERGSSGELRLLAAHGFTPQAEKFWEWVRADSKCSCGVALRTGRRVMVFDIEQCEFMVGTQDQAAYLQAGIHAVQSTPLISRDGRLLGMISTHWRRPHQPAERDLRLLDVLARQAADLIERKQAEYALRDNERRFREMIDALPAAIYTTDAGGRLTHFNPAAVEFSGREPELGTDHWCVSWKLYHANGRPMPHDECPMAVALKEGRVLHGVEAVAERPDGKRVWFMPYPTPLRDTQGKIVGGINMLVDITERKQAERAIASLAAIVESSDDAIISKDLNGVITNWNAGATRLFGYTAQETIGQPVTMLIPRNRLDEESDILKRIRHGESIQHYETVRCRKDGTLVDISLTVSPILDRQGHIVGASKIARDITERKQAEAQISQFTAELEQRVEERTSELTQSEDRLRTLATELNLAEQRERKRLAGELHDYLAQLLVLGRMTLGQAKRIGLPPRAEDLVKETEETLGKALTYCRTLMAELSPPVLQKEGLPAGLTWLADHMKRQDLAVTAEIPEAFDVPLPEDRAVLLFQSVRELLINVAKHGAVKTATVRMTAEEGVLRLVVRDENGFDLAAATAAADTSPLSSKFGLFSIRERMKALDGSFDIQSAPGQGTTATLVLPLAHMSAPGSELKVLDSQLSKEPVDNQESIFHTDTAQSKLSTQHLGPLRTKIRILLVDDHTLLRQGLLSIVSAHNHLEVVGEASDGMEAVELAQRLSPDVIVMDINMSRMGGIEATRRIKANQPESIIIGLSVNQSVDMAQRMKEAGVAVYLTKESAADALCHAIEAAVIQKRNSSDLNSINLGSGGLAENQ